MKIKLTEQLAVGYEDEDFLLVNEQGDVIAASANSNFDDLGLKIPRGKYLVIQVCNPDDDEQLGCTLNVIGCQWHQENEVICQRLGASHEG